MISVEFLWITNVHDSTRKG